MVNSRITAENVGKNNAMKVGQRKKVSDSVLKEQTHRRNFVISCNLLRCDAARRGLQDPHTWGCTGLVTEFSAAVELSLSSRCTTCNEVIKHRWCKLKLMQHILLRAPEYRFHHRVVRYPVGFEVYVVLTCVMLCWPASLWPFQSQVKAWQSWICSWQSGVQLLTSRPSWFCLANKIHQNPLRIGKEWNLSRLSFA